MASNCASGRRTTSSWAIAANSSSTKYCAYNSSTATESADSTILSALARMPPGSPELAACDRTRSLVSEYSRAGLRTLVLAKRREKRIRDSLARLESALTLLGATGVEDRLQEGVPRTVRALLDAGIIVWVLTGDKPETAINIAYSAALFSQTDKLLYLMSRDKERSRTIRALLDAGIIVWVLTGDKPETAINIAYSAALFSQTDKLLYLMSRDGTTVTGSRALVVDGRTLTYILDRRSGLVAPFLSLARRCSAVLCCRATPLQKAYIVKFVERLLLVHGHWCYDRLARMILYFFLKNAVKRAGLYSASRRGLAYRAHSYWLALLESIYISAVLFYCNLLAYWDTTVDVFSFGVSTMTSCLTVMLIYVAIETKSWNPYWLALLESIYISAVLFYCNLLAYWDTTVDVFSFGVSTMTSCLTVMLIYVAIETKSWHSYWLALLESIYISAVLFYCNLLANWDTTVDVFSFGVSTMTSCLTVMLLYVAIETKSWRRAILLQPTRLLGHYSGRLLVRSLYYDELPHCHAALLFLSIYISAVLFYCNLLAYWDTTVDVFSFGVSTMTSCLTVMLLYVAIETKSWVSVSVNIHQRRAILLQPTRLLGHYSGRLLVRSLYYDELPHCHADLLFLSIYISAVLFYCNLLAYWDTTVDVFSFGVSTMTSCLTVMLIYTVIHLLALSGSLISFFIVTLVYQSICKTCFGLPSTYHVIHHALADPVYWLVLVLTT
ncbi:Uncharacterized protein OBRU01_23686, partial [Operophtera brumata]